MDDLFGFVFVGAIVLGVIYLVAMFATTVLVNLYVLLEPVLAGFSGVPAPLAWGFTSGVFVVLLHFACAESPKLRRPGFGRAATAAAVAWLGLAGIVGVISEPAPVYDQYAQVRLPVPPGADQTPGYIPPPSTPPSPPTPPPPTPPQLPRPDTKLYETAYVDTQQLNVRKGPGSGFDVVDKVAKGALVRIFERRQTSDGGVWARIRSGSAEGWVSERYLRLSGAPASRRPPRPVVPVSPPQAKPEPSVPVPEHEPDPSLQLVEPGPGSAIRRPGQPYPTAYVAARQLNVRQGPGIDYPPVGRLSSGALVSMKARERSADGSLWVFIRSGSDEGWVSERALRIPAPTRKVRSPATKQAPAPGTRARVATTLLNVRAGPGVKNRVVGRVGRNTRVRVEETRRVEDDAIWARIRSNAVSGWVNAKFLESAP